MSSASARRGGQRVAGFLGVVILVASCGGSAALSPSPIPTPSPTASPTPSPIPSAPPSPTASLAAAVDPAAELKIAAPYTFATLDPALEATLRQQFAASLGAFSSLIGIGGREAVKDGALAGYVFVIALPPGTMTDVTYQSILTGLATSGKFQFKKSTVSGVDVSTGSNATVGYGAFRVGDHVIMVITPPATDPTGIATAVIAANQ